MRCFLLLSCCALLVFAACNSEKRNSLADHPAYHNPSVQSLTSQIEVHPQDASLYYQRSIALSHINQDSLALIDLQQAVSIDSLKPEYYQAIGFVQLNIGNTEGAVQAFRKNLALEPKQPGYMLLLAKGLLANNEIDAALKQVNAALAVRPQYPEAQLINAQIAAARGDTARAISIAEQLVVQNEGYYEASLQLADWYKATGNSATIRQYKATFAIDTLDATPLYEIGRFLEGKKLWQEAKDAYRECVMHDPDYSYAYIHYGDILRMQDSAAKAMRQYELAIATDPANGDAWMGKGQSFEQLKERDSARRYYQQALVFDASLDSARAGLNRLK